jgi:uncharacterized integral membrane protein
MQRIKEWLKKPKVVSTLALGLLLFIIISQNNEPVTFDLLFWNFYISKILIILASILIGMLIMLFLQLRRKIEK